MNKKVFSALCFVMFLVVGCGPKNNWVDLGIGPEKIADIPYRLIDLVGEERLPPTNSDMVSLTLSLQSGRGRGTWVYLPIFDCYGPGVTSGVPTVLCGTDSAANGDVYVGGAENIREILLSLKAEGKRAAIKGKVLGLYANTPVVWVNDPSAKK